MNMEQVSRQITILRKEKGYTQETLAEALNVSPQAVSKWENGHSLPETALLPRLAKVLDCSVDNLLSPSSLQILEALYGDGLESENVTRRLNRLVEEDGLIVIVNSVSMASKAAEGRQRYLLVKYQNSAGVFYTAVAETRPLSLNDKTISKSLPASRLEILAASYGNEMAAYDVMDRIKLHSIFDIKAFPADHAYFPSAPDTNGIEYLTVVYTNSTGIHMATCAEGEKLELDKEQTGLDRQPQKSSGSQIIRNVEELPGFGKGMECTWAGALVVALKAMGETASYEKVMGVSGACWRIAMNYRIWDYSAADALVVNDYAAPGYKAFGYKAVFAGRIEKENRTAERQNILNSIKNNRPVLGINLRVAFEWGVICGFKDNGKELLCRTYFDNGVINRPDFSNKPGTPEKYLPVDNWPFIIIHFSPKGAVPDDKENLINSLKVRIESMYVEKTQKHIVGYEAYQLWQADLRDDAWYKKADDEHFGRRLDVNYYLLLALCDARKAAAGYLKSSAGLIKGGLVDKMAGIYRDISDKLTGLLPAIPALDEGWGKSPVNERNMRKAWPEELRHKQADLFDEVIALEKQGEEIARKITGK